MGLLEKDISLRHEVNPCTRDTKDSFFTIRPVMNQDGSKPAGRRAGAFISRKFAEDYSDNLKALSVAIAIKLLYKNSCVYKYNPHKLAILLGMNYNTLKKHVDYLIANKVARIHNGNLTIRKLSWRHNHMNGARVYGDVSQILEQLRVLIVDTSITRQKKAIAFKKGLKTAALCKTLQDVKKTYKFEREHTEIGSIAIDERIRVTIRNIRSMLGINSRDAVLLRRKMISLGYGFCYQTRILSENTRYMERCDVPKNGYIHKGRLFVRESWVEA